MEAGNHEQMVKPAPPVSRDHAAIELRRSSEEQCVERAADVAIERLSARPRRREAAVEKAVREGQAGRRRPSDPSDQKRALDRKAVASEREGEIASRRRHVLTPEVTDHANPIALVCHSLRGNRARYEEKDFGGKRSPPSRDPESLGPEPPARSRRGVAPEFRQHAFDPIRPLRVRRQRNEGRPRGPILAGNADATLGEADARPQQEERGRGDPGRFSPEARDDEGRGEQGDGERSPLALARRRSQKNSGDEGDRRRQRGRLAGSGDRSDQETPALRVSVTTDSTRCVSGNRSYRRASATSKTVRSSARSRARVAGSHET